MKIGIAGGGPAGLYFALLMKRADPTRAITVYEQNPQGATYGWGIVFSGRALSFMAQHDPASYQDLASHLRLWDEMHIGHCDQLVAVDGSRFSGIGRKEMLDVLVRHCQEAGVAIHFAEPLAHLAALDGCDLVVGADGVNSLVRTTYAEHFAPAITTLTNKYIWYGTPHHFPALSLIFRTNADGCFVAHAYPYSASTSTFIVECDAATWRQARFSDRNEAECRAYCEELFAPDLAGSPLLSNKSAWLNFKAVSNRRWHCRNVVLLGDALHTAHFSIGSGTRTAVEDAIELFAAFQEHGDDVAASLQSFETRRRPTSDLLLTTARSSYLWYERFRDYLHLTPVELAYSYMTRSGQVNNEKLSQQAPKFMAQWQAAQGHRSEGVTA